MLTALLLALAVAPQSPRTPIPLGPHNPSFGTQLATDEDASAALSLTNDTLELRVTRSDGRGVAWSAQQVVKPAVVNDTIGGFRVALDGSDAVIAWTDRRYIGVGLWPGGMTAFVRTYDAASGALGPELELPLGVPSGDSMVTSLELATERVGSELRVHVALVVRQFLTPVTTVERVLLFTSHDGGASFPIVQQVSVGFASLVDMTDLAVAAAGDTVHVLWGDKRDGKKQVYYRRSLDAGASLDGAVEQPLTSGLEVGGVQMAVLGPRLVVGFLQGSLVGNPAHPDLFTRASLDGGATFGPRVEIPGVSPVDDTPSVPVLAVLPSGAFVVAWKEYNSFPSPSEIRRSRSTDGGLSWEAPALVATSGQPINPKLCAAREARERVLIAWTQGDRTLTRVSLDDGSTFGAPIALSGSIPVYQSFAPRLAWNDRYQNAIAAWPGAPPLSEQWIGGLRPQTLTPVGFTAGSTQVSAQCSAFDDGSPVAFVVAALTPGPLALPFGDGRALGLAADSLLVATLGDALHGALAAPLDASGAGATPGLPVALPAGLSLELVALSVDLATLSFGDISDVVHVQL